MFTDDGFTNTCNEFIATARHNGRNDSSCLGLLENVRDARLCRSFIWQQVDGALVYLCEYKWRMCRPPSTVMEICKTEHCLHSVLFVYIPVSVRTHRLSFLSAAVSCFWLQVYLFLIGWFFSCVLAKPTNNCVFNWTCLMHTMFYWHFILNITRHRFVQPTYIL